MTNKNNTRATILEVTQDLVQRKSISGVSFQELANLIGIKKGSMYYHFNSKDELSIAMLEQAGLTIKASFDKGQNKTAVQQLDYYINIFSDFVDAGKRMCPAGAFAGEWGNLSTAVKKQVATIIKIQYNGIKKIMKTGLDSGEFDPHGLSYSDLTSWFLSGIQGALLTSRIMDSKEHFDICTKSIKCFLYKNES